MSTLEERFDKAEEMILKRSFRKNVGFEEPYYIFDYEPTKELYVRERIEFLKKKSQATDLNIVVFDLYDIIIEISKEKGYLEKNFEFEQKKGLDRVTKAIGNMLRVTTPNNLVVKYIEDHSNGADVIFLTGIGKSFPLFRAHNVLNNLNNVVHDIPVVMFYPGYYNGQYLELFSQVKDDNHYRAFKLVD